MNEKMILTNELGTEITCTIVAMWTKDQNNYIAYTDGTYDNNGKEELYVSKYKKVKESLKMIPITSEKEWDYVDEYLEKNLFVEEEF